jgi:Leu/Phe-tRNA-protein transferase
MGESMSNDKCGLNRKQRERILHAYGFEILRSASGSHDTWINRDLQVLARTNDIHVPENLKSGNAQSPWQVTVPGDPASGTWHSIDKYARWCSETVRQLMAGSDNNRLSVNTAHQFNSNAPRKHTHGQKHKPHGNAPVRHL